MKLSWTWDVEDQRYILEDKRERSEEMDFCPVAGVRELCTVLYFSRRAKCKPVSWIKLDAEAY